MSKNLDGAATTAAADDDLAIGARVRVRRGQDAETFGVIVEDFGDTVGVPVHIGDTHIVDPARRWAIALDDGGLTFVDSEHLSLA